MGLQFIVMFSKQFLSFRKYSTSALLRYGRFITLLWSNSETLLVREIGNPSSRRNLVMKSLYERPSSVQTLVGGVGRLDVSCDEIV